jgi:glucose-1-phosphate thymidylyltransferase
VVGPNVSIASGSVLRGSSVRNSIVGADSVLEDCEIEQSLIGDHVRVSGLRGTASLGDHSEISESSR